MRFYGGAECPWPSGPWATTFGGFGLYNVRRSLEALPIDLIAFPGYGIQHD